jgi:hypothetical protein
MGFFGTFRPYFTRYTHPGYEIFQVVAHDETLRATETGKLLSAGLRTLKRLKGGRAGGNEAAVKGGSANRIAKTEHAPLRCRASVYVSASRCGQTQKSQV